VTPLPARTCPEPDVSEGERPRCHPRISAVTSEPEAMKVAKAMGFPVLIKATAGGGGRGMRVARNVNSLVNILSMKKIKNF